LTKNYKFAPQIYRNDLKKTLNLVYLNNKSKLLRVGLISIIKIILNMCRTITLIFILGIACHFQGFSQGFKATGIVGLNASQIDGDDSHGFHKLGLSAGARLSYATDKSYDLSLEMLYSQRGSLVKPIDDKMPNFRIKLNYFEFPVVFSLRDWYIEADDFYKVRAEAGISYGYLFGIDAPGYDVTNFRTHDVSYLIGAGLNLTKRFAVSLRYTSSFLKVYKVQNIDDRGLLSYFLTLRTEYSF